MRDTLPADTAVRRPIHPAWAYLIAPGMIVLPVVAAFAPAPLARWYGARGDTRMGVLDDHQAAQLTLGGRFHAGQTWANAAGVEGFRSGMHAELQAEDYWRPHHVRYLSLRGGPLWHPRRISAGGLTVGYVHADGDPTQSGPEIGLPFMTGLKQTTLRLEPTYVFSSSGLLWSYRMQFDQGLPGAPLFVGANMTWKSLQLTRNERHDFAASAVSILVGARF